MVPLGADWSPNADSNTLDLAPHVLDEVVHHAAEVGLLRDLLRIGRLSASEAEACDGLAGSSDVSVEYRALGHAERFVLHDQPADRGPVGVYWTCMQHRTLALSDIDRLSERCREPKSRRTGGFIFGDPELGREAAHSYYTGLDPGQVDDVIVLKLEWPAQIIDGGRRAQLDQRPVRQA